MGEKHGLYKGCKFITGKLVCRIRNTAKSRNICHPILEKDNVDYEYLYSIVPKDFRCPLSKMRLTFPKSQDDYTATASLDRIDSDKGHIKGSVQWIHKIINQMKWNFSQVDFVEMCKRVAKNYKKKTYGHIPKFRGIRVTG